MYDDKDIQAFLLTKNIVWDGNITKRIGRVIEAEVFIKEINNKKDVILDYIAIIETGKYLATVADENKVDFKQLLKDLNSLREEINSIESKKITWINKNEASRKIDEIINYYTYYFIIIP